MTANSSIRAVREALIATGQLVPSEPAVTELRAPAAPGLRMDPLARKVAAHRIQNPEPEWNALSNEESDR